jgi:hypothetical protein
MAAFRDGELVGVCGMARPTLLEKMRLLPAVIFDNPLGTPVRVLRWAGEWARPDLTDSHWHLISLL